MRPASTVNPDFLSNLIRSQVYREKLEQAAVGTMMKNLSNKVLSNLLITIPGIDRQMEILARLDITVTGTKRLKAPTNKS